MKHLRWWLISPNRYSKSISARLWFIFIHEDSFVDALTQVFLLSILLSTRTKRSIWYLINLKWKYTCNYTLLECKALFNWKKEKMELLPFKTIAIKFSKLNSTHNKKLLRKLYLFTKYMVLFVLLDLSLHVVGISNNCIKLYNICYIVPHVPCCIWYEWMNLSELNLI